jgi:hypothetical protein
MAYQRYSGVFTNTQAAQAKGQDKWVSSIAELPGDDEFANTTLLLQANGSDGDTNSGFIDSSGSTHTITRNGNVTQGSFSPFSQDEGKWGNYFDGDGDYLQLADDASFAFGTGDFTIEFWVYSGELTTDSIDPNLIDLRPTSTNGVYPTIFYDSSADNLVFYVSASAKINGGALSEHTWHHIAVARSGTSTKMFVDGTQVGSTYTDTNNYLCGSNRPVIGAQGFNPSATDRQLNGYMSNVRLVKGTAVYTSNFTPSTEPLTDITNTSLLTCQSNRFVDNSSNAHSITVNGDPEVVPFSPFAPSTAYNPATKGGSAYFDGTGDYLSIPDSPDWDLGSGNWTIDFWVYLNSTANQSLVSYQWENTSATGRILAIYINNSEWIFLTRIGTGHVATPVIPHQWNHIRLVRSGSTTYGFLNGKLASTASAYDYGTSSYGIQLGCSFSGATPVSFLNGYMSDVRIIRGVGLTTTDFTLPTAPVTSDANTTLLCNFADAGIFDATRKNVIETVGDAQVDTAVKKFGTGSMQFDGSGDYLQIPDSENFSLDSGDWTIEMWAYPNSTSRQNLLYSGDTGGANTSISFSLEINASAKWRILVCSGSTDYDIITSASASSATWTHIAAVRNGNTITLYINGTSAGTVSVTGVTVNNSAFPVFIGSGNTFLPYNGYIDDLRITKGVARYTANFTPPTTEFPTGLTTTGEI